MNRRALLSCVFAAGLVAGAFGFACGDVTPHPPDFGETWQGGPQALPAGATATSVVDGEATEGFEDGPVGEGGGACVGCVVLSSTSISPMSLALDSANVYWANAASGTDGGIAGSIESIARGSVSGMGVQVAPVSGPLIIAAAGGWLVWSASGSGSGTGTASQISTSGGTVSTPGTGLTSPWGVAVDAKNVYWVSSGGTGAGTLIQSALVGKAAASLVGTTLATYDTPGGLAVNATNLFFASSSNSVGGGAVFQVPIGGGTPQVVWATTTGRPQDVALDSNSVYWVDQEAGILYSTPLAMTLSGAAPKVLSTDFTNPVHLAVDSTNVYVADDGTGSSAGSIFRVPIGGGAPTALASGLEAPLDVAVDSSTLVYFSTLTSIASVPKQ